jgi:hypothetical protein
LRYKRKSGGLTEKSSRPVERVGRHRTKSYILQGTFDTVLQKIDRHRGKAPNDFSTCWTDRIKSAAMMIVSPVGNALCAEDVATSQTSEK